MKNYWLKLDYNSKLHLTSKIGDVDFLDDDRFCYVDISMKDDVIYIDNKLCDIQSIIKPIILCKKSLIKKVWAYLTPNSMFGKFYLENNCWCYDKTNNAYLFKFIVIKNKALYIISNKGCREHIASYNYLIEKYFDNCPISLFDENEEVFVFDKIKGIVNNWVTIANEYGTYDINRNYLLSIYHGYAKFKCRIKSVDKNFITTDTIINKLEHLIPLTTIPKNCCSKIVITKLSNLKSNIRQKDPEVFSLETNLETANLLLSELKEKPIFSINDKVFVDGEIIGINNKEFLIKFDGDYQYYFEKNYFYKQTVGDIVKAKGTIKKYKNGLYYIKFGDCKNLLIVNQNMLTKNKFNYNKFKIGQQVYIVGKKKRKEIQFKNCIVDLKGKQEIKKIGNTIYVKCIINNILFENNIKYIINFIDPIDSCNLDVYEDELCEEIPEMNQSPIVV